MLFKSSNRVQPAGSIMHNMQPVTRQAIAIPLASEIYQHTHKIVEIRTLEEPSSWMQYSTIHLRRLLIRINNVK